MHIHVCPTEIMLFMMIFDYMKIYVFHWKHVLTMKWYDRNCEVCND